MKSLPANENLIPLPRRGGGKCVRLSRLGARLRFGNTLAGGEAPLAGATQGQQAEGHERDQSRPSAHAAEANGNPG